MTTECDQCDPTNGREPTSPSPEKKERPGWPVRGTTVQPDGTKVVYDGDLTVLDEDGDVIAWMSSDLLEILYGEEEPPEDSAREAQRSEE